MFRMTELPPSTALDARVLGGAQAMAMGHGAQANTSSVRASSFALILGATDSHAHHCEKDSDCRRRAVVAALESERRNGAACDDSRCLVRNESERGSGGDESGKAEDSRPDGNAHFLSGLGSGEDVLFGSARQNIERFFARLRGEMVADITALLDARAGVQ